MPLSDLDSCDCLSLSYAHLHTLLSFLAPTGISFFFFSFLTPCSAQLLAEKTIAF